MSTGDKFRATLDRPATQHERDIIRSLLEHGDPQYLQLASQIESLRVVSKCTCGCPTIDFALEGDPPSRKGARLISDFVATVDDQDVGVLLFENDGKLSSLEVYSFAGSVKPCGLPKVDTLAPGLWEDSPSGQGRLLTNATLRKSSQGKEVHRADDAKDLFKKLGI
jgi:hypothetical protein